MTHHRRWHNAAVALIVLTTLVSLRGEAVMASQPATPEAASCDTAATPMATPTSPMGTPMAGMDHGAMATPAASAEFDQSYIDMMIPHHRSIIALAQVALPRLTDERLQSLAGTIIRAQTAEIDELRGYREQFYGSADPMPVDDAAMMQMMGGMSMPMNEMMPMMDADALVATFCASADPDLAFIDLTIPHHQSAIAASNAALQRATHDEIRGIAERVIEDQQREIDELTAIREDLAGSGTLLEAVA